MKELNEMEQFSVQTDYDAASEQYAVQYTSYSGIYVSGACYSALDEHDTLKRDAA